MTQSLQKLLIDLEKRQPDRIELGLDRVQCIAHRLELLEWPIPIIMVGGTNGKGSTVAALEAIYHQAGYQVGCYTSPHLLQFSERIRINQQVMDESLLLEAFCAVLAAEQEVNLTYFEVVTLAALWAFKQCALDIVILEVGLGGRLDAVNVVEPTVSIITNVGLDHQQYLGPDRQAIAREKLGITRPNGLFIFGETDRPPIVDETITQKSLKAWCCGVDYTIETNSSDGFIYHNSTQDPIEFSNLFIHPQNAASAITAVDLLQSQLPVEQGTMLNALVQLSLPGRCEWRLQPCEQVFDVGHNPHALEYLKYQLLQQPAAGHTRAVFSALNDKDIPQMVNCLSAVIDEWLIAPLTVTRAASSKQLVSALQANSIANYTVYSSLQDAYRAGINRTSSCDRLVICGSFYTVAECCALANETGLTQ